VVLVSSAMNTREGLLPKTTNNMQSTHRTFSVQLVEHKHILWLVDGLLVFVALLGGLWLGAQRSDWVFSAQLIWSYSPWFVGMISLYFFMATANGVYRPKTATNFWATTIALIKTLASIFVIYLLIYALIPPYTLPRHFTGFFALIALLLLLGWRRLYGLVFVMPAFQRRAIVMGAGWAGKTIVKTLNSFTHSYFRVIGFVDDDPDKQKKTIDGTPVLGPTNSLFTLALQHNATDVVLAITHDVPGDILANLLICYEQGLRVSTMPDLYERLTDRIPVEHVGDNWFVVLPFDGQGQNLSYRVAKRGLDVLIAVIGLSIFSLILPLLAIAIVLDSSGSIFYRQKRVGRGGQIFELVKLRSMVIDAEEDGQAKWAERYDKRVTRVGRFLRRTRLDEAPQLFNVLRGDMSLVGPRPERPEFVIDLQQQIPFYRTRLTVKPGLTGWAQVYYDYGRSVTDALEKLRYDLYYIKHQSIQLDLIILLKTISTILLFKGA
jgi:exopolysaccharide biosynthesis polyprenyl glycosylphosphotransferase